MKNFLSIFLMFLIYPIVVHGGEGLESEGIDTSLFDELPIKETEVTTVTKLFWNAKSIQDKVKRSLPEGVSNRFTPGDGCNVKAVTKTEPSADTCNLNDDPEKNAKFIYNFSVSCRTGNYQVSICSRQEAQLLNQLKVVNPEKLVSDDNPFDLDSTM